MNTNFPCRFSIVEISDIAVLLTADLPTSRPLDIKKEMNRFADVSHAQKDSSSCVMFNFLIIGSCLHEFYSQKTASAKVPAIV